MTKIKILAFGSVKDLTGWSEFLVENCSTLEELKTKLFSDYPALESKKNIQWAVNEEYVNDFSKKLENNDIVALIPPVSGG